MRKLILVVVALLVVALAAPVGARSVSNDSNRGYELGAWWSDDNGDHNVGMADAGSWQGIWVNVDTQWECEFDPDGWRTVHLSIHGEQYGQLDPPFDFFVVRQRGEPDYYGRLHNADAEGKVWVGVNYWDECLEEGFEGQFLVTLTMGMDGYGGRLGKSKDSSHTHFPGEWNEHSSMQTTFRIVNAFVRIDGIDGLPAFVTGPVDGSIAKATWRSHRNSK